jgi:hypothetical protein
MTDTIELADDEAAVVLRSDGDLELVMPDFEGEEVVPDDVLIMSAFMLAFREPDFRAFMLSLFAKEYRESHN